MLVYICEKPSQAADLAAVLGVNQRDKGFMHNGAGVVITWAFGHLLEMLMPDDYDEKYKSWSLETLPISPEAWKVRVSKDKYAQYKIVEAQVARAKKVVIATDFDREGEAIARSLLERFGYKGELERLCLTSLDPDSIKKALQNIKPGRETMPLYFAALARQRADWLVGMNISRLFTVLARDVGYRETLHVGRVITPTVALVCQRDNEIANFKPSPFYVLHAQVTVQNGGFLARWMPGEDVSDDQGRCTNKAFAEQVASQIKGASANITRAEVKDGYESAPLPFDLTSLQQYAANRWGYTSAQVLEAAQSLYETHKVTTYPRSDSRYLPDSQLADAPAILQNLIVSDPRFSGMVAGCNADRKSRAFNDKKVSAHHAIIPTTVPASLMAMTEIERNIYDAVRRHYVAQFYSNFEFTHTNIEVECHGHRFEATGKTPLRQGWKLLFADDTQQSDEDEDLDAEQESLPKVSLGEPARIMQANMQDKMTRPSPYFTEATLLGALQNISRFVTEEQFKKILRDTAGIGTPATRAAIIDGAIQRGYLKRDKKRIRSTDKAQVLISVLPEAIKSPGMTAAWEQELERIADGTGNMGAFMGQITGWVTQTVEQIKAASPQLTCEGGAIRTAFADIKPQEFPCFNCGGPLRRIKGSKGFFWACRNEACKKTFDDAKGKPQQRIDSTNNPLAPTCPDCNSAMRLRKGTAPGKKRASSFWGCTAYPECRAIVAYSKKAHGV